MMRRNLALVLTLALIVPAISMADGKRRKLDQLNTTKDRWDELMNSEQLEDDKPKREVIRMPARAPAAAAVAKPSTPAAAKPTAMPVARPGVQPALKPTVRQPANVPPLRAQAQPQAITFPVAAISFDEYLAENGKNPALSKAIPDHQVAFTDLSAPAVITIPGSESANAQATAAAVNPNGIPGATGANPQALQNAAAAAAAAGLIPAGAYGAGVPTTTPTQSTGGPAR